MIEKGEGQCIHDGRNKIVLFENQGIKMVAKRFKQANLLQRVAYTFWRPTKAKRAYLFANELRKRGIATPHEIAYFEKSECGFFKNGWFVCEACKDPQVFPLLVDAETFDEGLASAVAHHIAMMHEKGILFGDLNLCNFLYHSQDGGNYTFTMVDTNRSKFSSSEITLAASIRNLRTVTHRKDLYSFILREYAKARGLDEDLLTKKGMLSLEKFERAIARKYFFKNLLRRRNNM